MMMKFPVLQNIRILFYFYDAVILRFIKKPIRDVKRVLIVFPLSLGDAVMMYGTFEQISKIYRSQGYTLSIICHSEYSELFEPLVDEVIDVDLRKASSNLLYRYSFLKKCRGKYFDIVIDPTGAEDCTPGVYAVNAAVGDRKIGVIARRDKKYQMPKKLRRQIFTDIIEFDEKAIHRVRYYAEVFSEIMEKQLEKKLANLPMNDLYDLPKDDYIIVFPSASTAIKRWPVEKFAEITRRIVEKHDYSVVVCGLERDRDVTEKYISLLNESIVIHDYLEKTSVLDVIGIVSKASLVITNDTGIYHLAVATGRKTCCVTGDYVHKMFIDYESEGLADKTTLRTVMPGWACRDCENSCKKVTEETYPCVLCNDTETVWKEIKELLEL